MNVTLIYPLLSRKRALIDENKQFWPPLGLAYIASVLEKAGHRVQIIDRDIILRKSEMDFDRTDAATLDLIKGFSSDMVGISATTPNMSDAGYTARHIKTRYKDVPILLGGPHPSGEPVLSLKESPAVDIVVKGEGEFTVLDLANGVSLDKVNGIYYRCDGKVIANAVREPISDIDQLPLPARHLLDMKFYSRPSRFTSRNLSLRTTSLFTARGCPYRCNFCAGPLIFNGKVRFHSPSRVLSEIDELVARYGIEAIYFAEDMFLSSRKRAEELLSLFIEKGVHKKIKWIAQAKASIITNELLGLMKDAGCVGIEYGFESGSQRVLDIMNKRLTIAESLRAADLTRKAKMRFQANIIVGYPGEREEDFKQTIDFIKKVKPSMIGFNLFMPLPGTPSYEELKRQGKTLPKWDDIGDPEAPQINYADMPRETFEKLYLETRLKVILPMNLRSFLIDNARNPLRLVKVALTQFKGVLVKTSRSIARLRELRASGNTAKGAVLFLSYNGLLEPILPSQAVPYLRKLAQRGFKFVLFTYEKTGDLEAAGPAKIRKMRNELKHEGIEWVYLRYHKNPPHLSTLFDLSVGAVYAAYIILKKRAAIVHVRGITPGVIMIALSKLLRVKLLFDMRGLLAEEYVGGGLWQEGSVSFRLVKKAEKQLLSKADAVTVLTRKHLALNESLGYVVDRGIPMDVVPCCVDTIRFDYRPEDRAALRERLGVSDKFVLMYPGKIGTFYLMDEMLEFYKSMCSVMPQSVFVIITGDNTARVDTKAAELGIPQEKIVIVPRVPFDDMPRYVNAADAGIFFINPYKKIGSSPIKMGEFLACGVPVIINPGVGDTEEVVADGKVGVIVRSFAGSEYELAIQELNRLKSDEKVLRTRCRNAACKHLSLEEGVEKYAQIYETLQKNAKVR